MTDVSPSSSYRPGKSNSGRGLTWVFLLLICGYFAYVALRPKAPSTIEWMTDLDAALARAKESNRLIFVDFHADWCNPCQIMDKEVFSQREVAAALANWVPVSIDVALHEKIAARYRVEDLPAFVVLSPQGDVVQRFEGLLPPDKFLAFIASAEKNPTSKPAG